MYRQCGCFNLISVLRSVSDLEENKKEKGGRGNKGEKKKKMLVGQQRLT